MLLIYPSPGAGESAWGGNLTGHSLFPADWGRVVTRAWELRANKPDRGDRIWVMFRRKLSVLTVWEMVWERRSPAGIHSDSLGAIASGVLSDKCRLWEFGRGDRKGLHS